MRAFLPVFSQLFAMSKTTLLSRTLLAYAVQGVGDSSLIALIRCMGEPSSLDEMAREVDGIGHTSGADMMLGVADAAGIVVESIANNSQYILREAPVPEASAPQISMKN